MAVKSLPLLFIFLSVTMIAQVYRADAKQGPVVSGYTPADPKDPEIVEMGKFSIMEHNKKAYSDLKFITVVKAETQVVSGINYRMTISAQDSKTDKIKTYRAIVWSKSSEHVLQLVSFEQVQDRLLLGGWNKIDNVINDPEVLKVAKFAVAQHNEESGSNLMYLGIIRGEKQVLVAGIKYKLVIITKDYNTGKTQNYLAVAYTGTQDNIVQLRSFEHVLG